MTTIIGKKIKDRLHELEMTYADLAEVVGVSINAVAKWVRTGQISRDNLPKTAKALKWHPSELLPEVDHLTPAQPVAPEAGTTTAVTAEEHKPVHEDSTLERLNADEAQLIRCFRECSDELRQVLMSHARLAARSSHHATNGATRHKS